MSDKKKILFWPDVYKEQGHWLPTLAWADYINSHGTEINRDGFEIQYMGIADCEEIVQRFETTDSVTDNEHMFPYKNIFVKTYPYGYTNEVQTNPSNRWKPDHIWVLACAGFSNNEIKKFDFSSTIVKDAQSIRKIIDDNNPDMLVSGYFTSLETLIIYYHSQNSDYFNSLKNFAISTTYLRHPSEDPASRALQNLMAFSPTEQNRLINIVKNHKKDPEKWDDDCDCTLREFVSPLSKFDEFIPCPKIFDYSHYEHGSKVHYGEPCITKELAPANDESAVEDWSALLAEHQKIVFVTAGSQILDYKEKALILFQSIIDAMQASDMKDYHLILCAGSTLVQELRSEYENVTICGWAPQHQILEAMAKAPHKDCCAIIHGGLATIKECVYYNVPFLVLPLGKDQMDNALRLEDCGINNRFHLEYIKPKCLRYFINQILQDYKSRFNLKILSERFQEEERTHSGATFIGQLAYEENSEED